MSLIKILIPKAVREIANPYKEIAKVYTEIGKESIKPVKVIAKLFDWRTPII